MILYSFFCRKIPSTITIVMYWKPDKWCYPTNIKDMYDIDTVRWLEKYGLGEYIQDYRMHLFEPATVSDKVLNRFRTEIKDVIAYVKYSVYTDQIEHTARRYSAWLPPIQCTLSGHQCMMLIQV